MKKNVKMNFLYNIIYQALTIVIPLITAPYIARVLGPTGSGINSYTYSISYYFVIFAMLGINNYGNRLIAKSRDNEEKLNESFTSLYIAHIIISLISLVAYLLFCIFFISKYNIYFLIQSFYIIGAVIDINWLFYGLEEFKITVTRNIAIKLITTLCIFLLVKNSNDLFIYILILSFSNFISQLSLYAFLKKTNIKFIKVSKKSILQHLKPLVILFLPTFALNLYKTMDKIMLENMINVTEVGIYEYAERIMTLPTLFILALGTVMLPKISNLFAKKEILQIQKYIDKSIEFVIFISIPIVFGMISISDDFIPIFLGESYLKSADLLKILSISVPFISLTNVVQTQYLIPHEKDKEYIYALLIGVVINLILNILLINRINAYGACIATVISECAVMLFQFFKTKDFLNIRFYMKIFIKYFLKGLCMFFIVEVFDYFITGKLLSLIVKVIVGIVVYICINIKYIDKNIKFKEIIKRNGV